MRSLCAALAIATIVAVAGTPPAAAAGGTCKGKRKVVARTSQLVVFYGPRDADDRRALCASYRQRRPMAISGTSLDAGPDGVPRLAGRFVFLIERHYDRGTGDSYAYASLIDVGRRAFRHRWEFFQFNATPAPIAFHRVRLLRNGTVGFGVSSVESDTSPGGLQAEIHRAIGAYQDTLAAGTDVDPASLTYSHERMSWTEGGQMRTAAFL